MSILNKQVSMFRSATSVIPETIGLIEWLTHPKKEWDFLVEQVRRSEDKFQRDQFKKQLPAITASGTFSKRSKQGLLQHSGLLSFDVDNIGDSAEDIRDSIRDIPNVAYCGLSVSSKGVWGLIPILNPEKHEAHFRAIEIAFNSWGGITIDPSCKDVSRLRFYSPDPDAYFNHDAVVFTATYTPSAPVSRQNTVSASLSSPLSRAAKMITNARDGEKWITLTKASFLLGGYIGGGHVSEVDAREALRLAIVERGAEDIEAAYRTIEKGIKDGQNKPII